MDFDGTLRRISVSMFETEEERIAKMRTPEEKRSRALIESIFEKITRARELHDRTYLEPLAELWCKDGMYVNSRLAGSNSYPFAEPTCGGAAFVEHLQEYWFDWDVIVKGELGVDINVCGPVITFKNYVQSWSVRRSGRQVRSNDEAKPMVEHNAIHLDKDGKIQQWIYYVDSSKPEAFIHAFVNVK